MSTAYPLIAVATFAGESHMQQKADKGATLFDFTLTIKSIGTLGIEPIRPESRVAPQ